jgi:hypothetical protein
MKNVTISIDDDLHRKARVFAAERGTSLSALVKAYLENLTDSDTIETKGVRDMQVSFKHAPPELGAPPVKDGPPWLVDGKWVYTKDGKPRKPGALRHLGGGWTEDFDEWPQDILDSFEAWDHD